MRVGFVHLGGTKGDGVRNQAIRDYLLRQGLELVDIPLARDTRDRSLLSHLTLSNLESFISVSLGRRQASFLKDIDWNDTLRRLKKRLLPTWCSQVLRYAGAVDLFHAETHLAAYVCALVKPRTGKPFVFDMHGLLVEEMRGRNCPPGYIRFLQKVERAATMEADCVSVVSPRMKEVISSRYGRPPAQFVVIPNGTYVYPGSARFSKPLRVVFAGNFAPYERVHDFIGLAERFQGPEYEFVLIGDGELRDDLFTRINEKRLDMVYLFKKSYEKTLRLLCGMHVGVAPCTDELNGQAASSMKARDYVACGLPVITPAVGEWGDLIIGYDAGFVTQRSDPAQFAEALVGLSDQATWERKSRNAKRMAQEACLWDDMLKPLIGVYEALLAEQRYR